MAGLTLTFVNAHLAAFDEMVDRRNEEFHELSQRLVFAKDLSDVESEAYRYDFGAPEASSAVSLYETDALFWFVSKANKLLVMTSSFSREVGYLHSVKLAVYESRPFRPQLSC